MWALGKPVLHTWGIGLEGTLWFDVTHPRVMFPRCSPTLKPRWLLPMPSLTTDRFCLSPLPLPARAFRRLSTQDLSMKFSWNACLNEIMKLPPCTLVLSTSVYVTSVLGSAAGGWLPDAILRLAEKNRWICELQVAVARCTDLCPLRRATW